MKQYAIIGASTFGKRILEELILLDCEIILIDKDQELIDLYKNEVAAAYIANVINQEIIRKLVPPDIDAVVVDLGNQVETSILVTQYLRKLGVKNIIVKAETDQHGEILEIVGATFVVFPNLEAAKRVTPLLVSDLLFNYLPIAGGLVIAETGVPPAYREKNLREARLRQTKNINVVAFRPKGKGDYLYPPPDHRFQKDDVLLIAGKEEDVTAFAGRDRQERRKGLGDIFRQLLAAPGDKSRERI